MGRTLSHSCIIRLRQVSAMTSCTPPPPSLRVGVICCRAEFGDESKPLPRPENWGGFLMRPLAIEFWQGRPSRLHDRLRYRRERVEEAHWKLERLSP